MRVLALALSLFAGSASADSVATRLGQTTATFDAPTTRYGHNVLGNLPEWGKLCLTHRGKGACITLPESAVFEDIAPRLADTNGDGIAEAIVVESSTTGGASLVVYQLSQNGLTRRATPPIGQRNRWLAPIGLADFDADGTLDVAYVETPHLGKRVRVWSIRPDGLVQIAQIDGYSNHAIGERMITSAIQNCPNKPPAMIVPTADRRHADRLTVRAGEIFAERLGLLTPQRPLAFYENCG